MINEKFLQTLYGTVSRCMTEQHKTLLAVLMYLRLLRTDGKVQIPEPHLSATSVFRIHSVIGNMFLLGCLTIIATMKMNIPDILQRRY